MLLVGGGRNGTGDCSDATSGEAAIKSPTCLVNDDQSDGYCCQGSSCDSGWLHVSATPEVVTHLSADKRCPGPTGKSGL